MKLTIFLFFLAISQMMAVETYSQSTRLSLNLQSVAVKDVLDQIEQKSEFVFLYNSKLINVDRTVSVNVKDQKISDVLDKLFQEADVVYTVVDRQIVLTNSADQASFLELSNAQQRKSISGKVTDSSGASLPGVSVVVKGTATGVITDNSGNYTLSNIADNATLQFSFVGMKSQEIPVSGKSNINVGLVEEAIGLDEVVAIGYGTQKKGALTGSVSIADGAKLASRPITNAIDGIQGLISGVTVTRSSGAPGNEGYNFNVRGTSSINGNQPLVMIDGMPSEGFANINPEDIKDVTVLKDAAASIYGSRAADGVILITTKRGGENAPVLEYSTNIGIKQPGYFKRITNTYQLYKMFDEASVNSGNPARFTDDDFANVLANNPVPGSPGKIWYLEGFPLFYQTYNHNKLMYKNSVQQNHNLKISGGTDKMHYLLSGGYLKDNGTVKFGENKFSRYNLRSNFDFNITNKLKIDTRLSLSNGVRVEPTQLSTSLTWLPRMWSFEPTYTPSGKFYQYQGYANVFQWLEEGGSTTNNDVQIESITKIDYELIEGLIATGQAGLNYSRNDNDVIWKSFDTWNWDDSFNEKRFPNNARQHTYGEGKYSILTGYLNYSKSIDKIHNLNVMLGASHEQNKNGYVNTFAQRFITNNIFTYNLYDRSDVNNTSLGETVEEWAMDSYFGRVAYNFNNRYFLDATLRQDASSKFAPEKRKSSLFPAVSVAWKISEESFIKKLHIFDELKFRLSYGKSGNQDISSLPTYGYVQLININAKQYPMGIANTPLSTATVQSPVASPERTWETIENKNIGVDILILNSRLNITGDLFTKKNLDMLLSPTLPQTFGTGAPVVNLGTLKTNGWELTIGWKDKKGDIQYGVKGNIWNTDNLLTDLQGNDIINEGWNYAVQGQRLGSYFGYLADGIIQNEAELIDYKSKYGGKGIVPASVGIGDVRYKDLDGDGTIQPYANKSTGAKGDLINLGSSIAKLNYSLNFDLVFKNFDFSAIFYGQGNRTIVRSGDFAIPFEQSWWQPAEWFFNKTWAPDRPNAPYGRLTHNATIKYYNYKTSTLQANTVAFIALRNVQLGYTVPKSVLNKVRLEKLRIYVSGQDLFNFNKGTWNNTFHPEEGSGSNAYPFYKTYSIGLNVTL